MAALVVSWPVTRNVQISGSNMGYKEERWKHEGSPYVRERQSHSCHLCLEGWPGLAKSRDPLQLYLMFP